MYDSVVGLLNVQGKLGFIGTDQNVTKLYIDGKPTRDVLGDIKYAYASKEGKVATFSKNSDLDWTVRIDGIEVYRGMFKATYGTKSFGFYGEKLLFEIYTDKSGTSAIWYDGEIVGEGYIDFEPVLVNGKLVMAAHPDPRITPKPNFTLFFEN